MSCQSATIVLSKSVSRYRVTEQCSVGARGLILQSFGQSDWVPVRPISGLKNSIKSVVHRKLRGL